MKRNRVTRRTEQKEGLEIVREIGMKRDKADRFNSKERALDLNTFTTPSPLALTALCTYTHLQEAQNSS